MHESARVASQRQGGREGADAGRKEMALYPIGIA
jgi:hypothetical protein